MTIEKEEYISLFILLSRHEEELDIPLQILKGRIEKELYTFMSIEEIENLLTDKAGTD